MRRYLSLILLLFLPMVASAQQKITMEEKNIYKEGTKIILEYSLKMEGYQWCELVLYISFDGGKTFVEKPLDNVTGDIGRVSTSGLKKIVWDAGSTIEFYAGRDLSFKIDVAKTRKIKTKATPKPKVTAAATPKPKATAAATSTPTPKTTAAATPKAKATVKKRDRKPAFFIMGNGALPLSQKSESFGKTLSFGGMVGWTSPKIGFYAKGLSNFKNFSPTYTVDNTGKIIDDANEGEIITAPSANEKYIFATGNKGYTNFTVVAGLIIPLGKDFFLNVGGGYGSRQYLWETVSGEWAKVDKDSFKGVAADAGCIIKIGPVAISFGVGYIVPTYINAQIGIGVAL